jgi:RNA polymerase sigma-70 factor, ECF subfamily
MELASSASRVALDADARAAAGGDRAAFERLYRATCARVTTLARRLVGPGRADEATQEVYLRAWRGLPSWRGEASARTWLETLARNTLIHVAARRLPAGTPAGEALAEHAAAPRAPELRLDLEAAIAALPDGARLVFVLHDVERCSHEEIAAELGIAVGTSKSQLHRARLLLRAALAGTQDEERARGAGS